MPEQTTQQQTVHVSSNFRLLENGHILLWLVKDTCWAMVYKPGGVIMIVPTIGMALYILWKTRKVRSEFFHNLAVCFWISANSVWMLGEFFAKDDQHSTKPVAVALFLIGLTTLLIYYIFFFAKDRKKEKEYTLTVDEG